MSDKIPSPAAKRRDLSPPERGEVKICPFRKAIIVCDGYTSPRFRGERSRRFAAGEGSCLTFPRTLLHVADQINLRRFESVCACVRGPEGGREHHPSSHQLFPPVECFRQRRHTHRGW